MKRTSSYRNGLTEALRLWFPGQFFSRWPLSAGLCWTPQRLFYLGILLAWSAEQTLGERFDAGVALLRTLFPHWCLGTTYTGWYEAQARWLDGLQPVIAARLRRQVQDAAGRHRTREGWCAFAVDGSRVECPRTRANEQTLGCAGKQRTAPQLFLTTVWHMGTGLPWDYRLGPGTASERRHLEEMLADLPPQALLVADAGFTGYDLYRRILAAGHSFLLRVGSNVHLLRQLGTVQQEGPATVYLWPQDHEQEPPLKLRLIVRGEGQRRMHLVTNVLEAAALSDQAAGVLYELRWGVEVFFRSTKQTLQRRRMLSRTPAAARGELHWAVLGLWLLGLLSVTAILARAGDPLAWSAALARRRVRQAMRPPAAGRPGTLLELLGTAVQDGYQRHGSKRARNWPHKKREKPPGDPKIEVATAEQRRKAQAFTAATPAA